jgi:hypothetical protein
MLAACVLLWSSLCVTPPYRSVTELTGFVVAVDRNGHRIRPRQSDIDRLGAHISVWSSDNIVARQPSGLPEACVQNTCVRYRKNCDLSGLSCDYEWGSLTHSGVTSAGFYTRQFMITARSRSALARAQAALFLPVEGGNGGLAIHLPVSLLTDDSPLTAIPACERDRASQGCPDMSRPARVQAPSPAP